MALGFGKKEKGESPDSAPNDGNFGEKNYYDGFTPDTEAQGGQGGRKMSRIDRPVTGSIAGHQAGRSSVDASAEQNDHDLAVGKQMELESGNSIKYRTCSWQKV